MRVLVTIEVEVCDDDPRTLEQMAVYVKNIIESGPNPIEVLVIGVSSD